MESIPETSLRDQLSGLSPDALQALLLSLPSDENTSGSNIENTDKESGEIATGLGLFPATYAQILFWRQFYADPNESSNNQSMAFRIHGPLDVEALKASFQILSESQPALRTVFFEDEHDVWQKVLPSLMLPFEFIDLVGASYDVANESADIEAFLRWSFDLESQPPMRVRLVCYKKDHHMLQIVMHHIASDGKSKVVLLEELSEYYNAIITGHKTEARTQRTSFASLAITEREWLKGDEATAMLRYWRDRPFAK